MAMIIRVILIILILKMMATIIKRKKMKITLDMTMTQKSMMIIKMMINTQATIIQMVNTKKEMTKIMKDMIMVEERP